MKSMFKIKNVQRALLAAGLIAATTNAFALTQTTTFLVQASVANQCNVAAAGALDFSAVDPLGPNVDGTTTVTVKCTGNTTYTVGLNAGSGSGTFAQRLMTTGAATMMYNLYKDSSHSTIWTNSAPDWTSGTGNGLGNGTVLTVYGRVPSGQTNLAAGSYSDTITVLVTY
jgi:spore coat protein U-like protein